MNIKNKIQINKQNVFLVLIYIFICITIIPVIIACFFGLPSADDFSNSNTLIELTKKFEGNYFKSIIEFLKNNYLGWQGTYSGIIFITSLPYHFGGLVALRIEMIITAICFFISLFLSLYALLKYFTSSIKINSVCSLLIYFCSIFYLINFFDIQEIFYWHTGLSVYTIPLIFCFITFFSFFYYYTNKNKVFIGIGVVTAIIAAGGSLDISGFLCSVLLVFICIDFFINRKIYSTILIGITAFIGSIINAFAPGNFVRHEYIDKKLNIMSSFFKTSKHIYSSILEDLQFGFLLPLFIIVFILSFYELKDSKIKFKYPFLITLSALISCIITDFPVFLGYNGESLPTRCIFIEKTSLMVYTILISIYWSGWFAEKQFKLFTKEFFIGLTVVCVIPLSMYLLKPSHSRLLSVKMLFYELKGDYKKVSKKQEKLLNSIKESTDENIILYIEPDENEYWTNIKEIGLTEDTNDWINIAVSKYYNKNSIVVIKNNNFSL